LTKKTLCPVILAGGGGTRLWPLSRGHYPKQFLTLKGENSMLQKTLLRLDGFDFGFPVANPIVICNEEHRFLVVDHAESIGKKNNDIILEPVGRNTAPALTVAALRLDDPDTIIVMMPADHMISDIPAFQSSIKEGYKMAQQDYLVTFGITPTKPETGYGYIRTTDQIKASDLCQIFDVAGFVEKPDEHKARVYLDSGDYYWNSGIFMMKASVWIKAIKEFNSEIYEQSKKAVDLGKIDNEFYRLNAEEFSQCPDDSIDYAVMEKLPSSPNYKSALITLDAGWSDIGSWSAVWDLFDKDNNNNVIKGDVIIDSTNNSVIFSQDKLIATIGCENLLVIETADAVLVGNRDNSQDVKKIVAKLEENRREERLTHRQVFRPWGSYESLDEGDNFQVKRLTVKPGKKLSLQLHHQRAEHWVVVKGTATVTKGSEIFELHQNESTYIPLGEKHRLENRGEDLLEVIEVQSGDYLGEDDIVRFDDDFGRVKN